MTFTRFIALAALFIALACLCTTASAADFHTAASLVGAAPAALAGIPLVAKPLAGAIDRELRRKDRNDDDSDETTATVKAQLKRISDQVGTFCKNHADKVDTFATRLNALELAAASGKFTGGGEDGPTLNFSTILEADSFKQLQAKTIDRSERYNLGCSVKALINFTGEADTANGTFPGQAARTPGFHGFALRPLRLLDLLPSTPIDSNSYEYVRLNFSGEADVQDGEGAEKAEMEFDGDLVDGKVQTIAVHTTASAQVLDDEASLQATLTRIMTHSVLAKVETQLVTGSGTGQNVEGIYTASTAITTLANSAPDKIGEAITAMSIAGYVANVILMHPKDWLAISLLKDAEGRYLYGNPASPAPPSLWNLPVVTSPSIPEGHALVGDTSKINVRDRMQPSVIISRDHKDYRTRNLVLILVEARVGLEVYDALAFRKIDLTDVSG